MISLPSATCSQRLRMRRTRRRRTGGSTAASAARGHEAHEGVRVVGGDLLERSARASSSASRARRCPACRAPPAPPPRAPRACAAPRSTMVRRCDRSGPMRAARARASWPRRLARNAPARAAASAGFAVEQCAQRDRLAELHQRVAAVEQHRAGTCAAGWPSAQSSASSRRSQRALLLRRAAPVDRHRHQRTSSAGSARSAAISCGQLRGRAPVQARAPEARAAGRASKEARGVVRLRRPQAPARARQLSAPARVRSTARSTTLWRSST